jgi:hypothetical protein
MSIRFHSFSFLVVFAILAAMTSHIMWGYFEWRIIPYLLIILSVAAVGENLVSSQGYYHYTKQNANGPFFINVPLWIVFLWVFCVQACYIGSIYLGLSGFSACFMSGILASIVDLLLLEPYLSRTKELWRWTPVENGYFRFIPPKAHRFTAPPGNYIAWLMFPILANCFLVTLMIII